MLFNRKISCLALLWLGLASVLSGCSLSFAPLYGDKADNEIIDNITSMITVKAGKTPFDFEFVQQLRWALYQGGTAPEHPHYEVTYQAKKKLVKTSIERDTGAPRSYTLILDVEFKLMALENSTLQPAISTEKTLSKPDKAPVFQSRQTVRTPFDSTEQRYRRRLAEEQAEVLAIKEAVRRFKLDLTVFIKQGHLKYSAPVQEK